MDKTFKEMREDFNGINREFGERYVIPRKNMYTVGEISFVTGIAKSTLAEDFRADRIASFMPPGRKRGMLARAEWIDDYLAKGKKEAIGC